MKLHYLFMAYVLTGCCLSINQIQNEGEGQDMIDGTQSPQPEITGNIPLNLV